MTYWWLILAELGSWLGGRFQASEGVSWRSWLGLLILAGFIAGLIGLSKWLTERDPTLGRQSSRSLFRELASAHRLTWREIWLLKRVARAGGLKHPVHVFIDPSIYENQQIVRQLEQVWPRVQKIRAKIFAAG